MTEENLLLEMGDILPCVLKDKSGRILSEGTEVIILANLVEENNMDEQLCCSYLEPIMGLRSISSPTKIVILK